MVDLQEVSNTLYQCYSGLNNSIFFFIWSSQQPRMWCIVFTVTLSKKPLRDQISPWLSILYKCVSWPNRIEWVSWNKHSRWMGETGMRGKYLDFRLWDLNMSTLFEYVRVIQECQLLDSHWPSQSRGK